MSETIPRKVLDEQATRILTEASELLQEIKDYPHEPSDPSPPPVAVEDFMDNLRRLEDEMDGLRTLLSGQSTEFSAFLKDMSDGFVEAQRSLDDESYRYLQSTYDQDHIPPTTFRIPKLKASMRFQMERSIRNRAGLVFYSNTKTASEAHQQGIEFEITAAPAPPELSGAPRPQILFAIDRPTRDKVFEALGVLNKNTAEEMLVNRARVLIAMIQPDLAVLAYPGPSKDNTPPPKNAGIFRLHIPEGGNPTLVRLVTPQTYKDQANEKIHKLIHRLANQQMEHLKHNT